MGIYTKVLSGQALNIRADTYNSFIDAAKQNQQNQEFGGSPQTDNQQQYSNIRLKNDTDDDYSKFDVVGLGSSLFTFAENEADYKTSTTLQLEALDIADHTDDYAILTTNINAGEIGEAIIIGSYRANILVVDTAHEYAEITDGEVYLTSCEYGSIAVLDKDSIANATVDDTILCDIRIGIHDTFPPVWEATADEASGEITAKRVDSTGVMVGSIQTFLVLPDRS